MKKEITNKLFGYTIISFLIVISIMSGFSGVDEFSFTKTITFFAETVGWIIITVTILVFIFGGKIKAKVNFPWRNQLNKKSNYKKDSI